MRRTTTWRGTPYFEQLETRCLLAGNTCGGSEDETEEIGADDLLFDTAAIGVRDAGSTMGSAYDLGQLGATRSFDGYVGGLDYRDVMRFTIDSDSTVTLGLTELRADIDLALYDSNGRRLAASDAAGTTSESIVADLAAGTYFIVVTPWRWAASTYVLSVGATAHVADPPAEDSPAEDPPADTTDPPVTSFPDVAYYGGSNEWNLNAINAPESWAQGYTGEGAVVAVIDTGVDLYHPDLVHQIWVNAGEIAGNGIDDDGNGYVDDVSGWDFAAGDNNPDDVHGHGTHVAGTIAAESNGFGATGVAPDATIMPVRVLGDNGSGSASSVAAGIRYAAANGADIINLSLGGAFSSVILSAIEYALQLDVLVVAAAGNESATAPGYPARFAASLSNVISVGAHSSAGAIASFSNDVGASGAVQVDAPGVSVYSTYVNDGYGRLSGTSMAAPHVAGLAALALSANSALSATELRSLITAGADRSIGGSDAIGRINAATTVALAAGGQSSTSPSASSQSQSAAPFAAVVRLIFSSIEDDGVPVISAQATDASAADDASLTSLDDLALLSAPREVMRSRRAADDLAVVALVDDASAVLDEEALCEAIDSDEAWDELAWHSQLDALASA
ncbi:MAG: peptidase S8 [Planctomycetota bacterium]|nr:MAG: peptidase S8 [Planctomycetota bacterium]